MLCELTINPVVEGVAGDHNLDGTVGLNDVLLTLSEFGCEVSCTSDMNGDGVVTLYDILTLLTIIGNGCD